MYTAVPLKPYVIKEGRQLHPVVQIVVDEILQKQDLEYSLVEIKGKYYYLVYSAYGYCFLTRKVKVLNRMGFLLFQQSAPAELKKKSIQWKKSGMKIRPASVEYLVRIKRRVLCKD